MSRLTEQEKEKKREYHKKYYHEKKDKINERRTKRVICEKCDLELGAQQLYRHRNNKTCLDRQKLIEKAKQQAREEYKEVIEEYKQAIEEYKQAIEDNKKDQELLLEKFII